MAAIISFFDMGRMKVTDFFRAQPKPRTSVHRKRRLQKGFTYISSLETIWEDEEPDRIRLVNQTSKRVESSRVIAQPKFVVHEDVCSRGDHADINEEDLGNEDPQDDQTLVSSFPEPRKRAGKKACPGAKQLSDENATVNIM
ncbi:uncharacterized protein LOC100904481 [Galendromus occidentalis]|uniref:Uncharacterized protein LOC100904481 n=1 Tax=Galendromus occidentalis TaxID=34638 RepID=A0AAJ6VZV4_9ACAR|nr:uncharacterized protein LOC100904481 [Galendromus occidentalis]